MADWPTVRLPKELMKRVEDFVETNYAKRDGFTNKSQIMVIAVREFLQKYSKYQNYLEYVESEKQDELIVKDYAKNNSFKIKINFEEKNLFCNKDNSKSCEHVKFLFSIPKLNEKLKNVHYSSVPKLKQFTKDELIDEIIKVKEKPLDPSVGELTNNEYKKLLKKAITKLD